MNASQSLRDDAIAIWQAGVDAVRGDRLLAREIQIDGRELIIGDERIDLNDYRRLVVVGAGKATAAMADGLLEALGPDNIRQLRVIGWINVPDGTFEPTKIRPIVYYAARPAGLNEPTGAAVYGTKKILDIVSQCDASDLVLCLISGGGSALLCAPPEGISLADKVAVTRLLSERGANIEQLNMVRRELSLVKAGGLARACKAGRLVTLILSDVLGDPINLIASGPTILAPSPGDYQPFEILKRFDPELTDTPPSVVNRLMARQKEFQRGGTMRSHTTCDVSHQIIGNNATAVDFAGQKAVELQYAYWMQSATRVEGDVESVADRIVQHIKQMHREHSYNCLILGGEPSVVLPPSHMRGLGGRNQQLALAVLIRLLKDPEPALHDLAEIAFVSGGTDGEDGPTDAAGACIDAQLIRKLRASQLIPEDYHRRCDAYHFFDQLDSLLKTGPTRTNVCDLRVAVVRFAR